jgi:hypothetical protein
MAFRSTVPQERPEYALSNDLHEEVAADVVTESGAAGTTVSVVASLSIAVPKKFRSSAKKRDFFKSIGPKADMAMPHLRSL